MTEGVTGAGFAIVSFEVGGEVEEGTVAVLLAGAVVPTVKKRGRVEVRLENENKESLWLMGERTGGGREGRREGRRREKIISPSSRQRT